MKITKTSSSTVLHFAVLSIVVTTSMALLPPSLAQNDMVPTLPEFGSFLDGALIARQRILAKLTMEELTILVQDQIIVRMRNSRDVFLPLKIGKENDCPQRKRCEIALNLATLERSVRKPKV